MQLDKLTLEQQVKHVWQSSPQREVLLAQAKRICDLEFSLKVLTERFNTLMKHHQPQPQVEYTVLPKKKGDK